MEKIIFGVSRPHKWKIFSSAIMTAYRIPYSHTYIKIWSEKYGRYLIYQASGTMVNFMNVKTFNEEALVVYETQIEVSKDQRSKIIQFAIDTCGRPYGVKDILGLAWVRINEFAGRKIKNPFSDQDKTLICSELTSIVLRDCLNISLPKDPDDMTPKDVYELLLSINPNNTMNKDS